LVEAQQAWHHELGTLDSTTSSIVRGLLVMPKISTPSQRKVLRNHPSWEDNPEAQAALGPIIAKWLTQGVLEYIQWDDRQPVLLQPCGAVPKGSAPFYRLITDARFGNSMYSDWGVTYASAADLSASLQPRDFTWSADLQDAYHLSVFAGCGGALRPCKRPVPNGDGSVSWIDGYIVGCSPDTCLGGCDKDMSGISIAGHIFRFAACQFGQKTAGSPLNSLVMSVARFFARLPSPVHVAAWVDDLHFSMRTPDHPPCDGHLAGCPVCTDAYHRAVAAEALWRQKAKVLNLPLSEGKGHSAAQGGPFTGVFVDTLLGRYTMLADKLASLRATFVALVHADASTPRLLAQGRGKAAHYGCAIPHLASMCPSLTQAMHDSEHAFSLPPPEPEDEASDRGFDWDRAIPLSIRTRATLRLMLRTIDEFGTSGQPIWPILAASAHGHFLAGSRPGTLPPVAAAFIHATPLGWGASLRLNRDSPPVFASGPWEPARALISPGWTAQPAFSKAGCPLEPCHQLALAALMGLTAIIRLIPAGAASLLLRVPDAQATRALLRGSSSDPVLQDISMLFTTACFELNIPRPWLLEAPSSRSSPPDHAADPHTASMDSANSRLRRLVHDTARQAGLHLTIDLFATASNTQCPRFYSTSPEPASAGVNALDQDSWAHSLCPWCQAIRPECCLLFPPFPLLRASLLKARADQAHGIAIVPCAHTAAWWPIILDASRTKPGSRDPYLRLVSRHNLHHCTSTPGSHHALLHFDFWAGASPRPRACPHGHLPRGAHVASAAADAADSNQIRLTLEQTTPTLPNDRSGP
jgi:hypothetical protein